MVDAKSEFLRMTGGMENVKCAWVFYSDKGFYDDEGDEEGFKAFPFDIGTPFPRFPYASTWKNIESTSAIFVGSRLLRIIDRSID